VLLTHNSQGAFFYFILSLFAEGDWEVCATFFFFGGSDFTTTSHFFITIIYLIRRLVVKKEKENADYRKSQMLLLQVLVLDKRAFLLFQRCAQQKKRIKA